MEGPLECGFESGDTTRACESRGFSFPLIEPPPGWSRYEVAHEVP